jgi:uncharacterized membrane protein
LTVNVNYGTAPCTHANPSITVSPSNPSVYAGSSVNYTVSVTNNDASGCSAASFTMAGGQPSGWSSTFSSGLLTLNPGQTGSVTLTESVPIGTTPATYALMASASNGPYAASAPANCTVLSAPATPVLTVNLSTSASSYSARQTVSATATVASGTTAATGAAVTFTILKADGTKVTKTATTGSNGSAALNYKLSPKDPKGVYSCVAQATYNAQSAASNTVSFTVK